ncbi:hypothetical protein BD414DRAFT_487554 [Trametes punicea]|nr:hypothetical protein BD414DRAFT_487554 [Trametes punicea]
MGFFSARRSEEFESAIDNDASVVRVIRSKFYGKPKGKEREVDHSFYTASASAASTTSFATNKADKRSVVGSIRGPRTSTSTSRNRTGSSNTSPRRPGNVSDMSGLRSSTDAITVTLAQRLNELATANSEGLLSDDEYRLLRQNLFERFASGSSVPVEAPLVPMSKPAQSAAEPRNSMSHQRHPSSNFHVQAPSLRAASIQSKKSFASTVTGLLRRATSRRIVSMAAEGSGSDTMSVYSMASSPPERSTLPRRLSKQTSDLSLHKETSSSRLSQSYNRRTIIGNHTFSAIDPGPVRTRTRSGSKAPPSAFPGLPKSSDTAYTHISIGDIPDDDTVESVQDIKHQIELVEAEGRRLLDAFNGLELSTLTRRQRKPPVIPPIPSHGPLSDATWLAGDKRSIRGGKDSDALSYKSNGSGRTTMSMKRSPSIGGRIRTVNSVGTLVSQQHGVMRKSSFSSVSSRGRTAPSLPNLATHLGIGSSSSVNLARSTGHLPLETVEETEGNSSRPTVTRSAGSKRDSRWAETASMGSSNPVSPVTRSDVGSTGTSGRRTAASQIDDEELLSMEAELADIRRRRAEVTARYESRLEYLRARLKGAELREKVLRK